ncbi:ATP-binding protein [Pseudoalteromonas denitrificans]|uniref:Anti-sigma regulatory factor (Ser/Thr protein kinase) n=1 Tax=Pseudoalteromonas denitrificans DSM 6059 TaxID=1123010 RepID=A0A1I1NN83_9GAMM|nr:ATP-binding protein [Pseudoalteromonas denitrificans]SFC99144.1 Anti-sigma regulatory factor (Ser/Thr protein kinase) [Pseudoalteromonas denitrificans DSM 6059]
MLSYGTPDLPNTNNPVITKTTLYSDVDAYNISTQVKAASLEFGFTLLKANLIALAASEMMINAIRYACNASILINQTPNKKGLIIKINDEGTGIDDVDLAKTPGFSSHNSLGLGFDAANRAVDEMYVNTSKFGTNICLIVYLPINESDIDFGTVSYSEVGKYFNRDGYHIIQYHGENVLFALFDCHETEPNVTKVNALLQTLLKTQYTLPLDELLKLANMLLNEHNFIEGTYIALLRITKQESQYIILGEVNISQINAPDTTSTCTRINGRLGKLFPKTLPVTKMPLTQPFCFMMFSDGIKSTNLNHNQHQLYSATKHAEKIFDTHAVTNNDATIIVVKSHE